MKKQSVAAVAAALVLGAPFAQASSTFNLEIRGAGEYGDYYTPPQPNGDPLWPVYWYGMLTVKTSSNADGVYTGAALQEIDYTSNYGDWFWYHAGDGVTTRSDEYGTFTSGMEPGASVTVSGGRITSVDFSYLGEWPGETGDGLQASGTNIALSGALVWSRHGSESELTGTAINVPEPAESAMLLVGLALIGTRLGAGRRARNLR